MKVLVYFIISLLTFTGFVSAENYLQLAEKAISRAGDNSTELQKALNLAPAEQKKGMAFLIAYMPQSDLTSLKAEFLLENCKWAYMARNEFPWAKSIPEDVFLNNVLPYASLNERRDDWRKDFYQRFTKHTEGKTTLLEAILAVNSSVRDEVKVEYNTKRKKPDQSPYESMEINMASCTGLSILLTDAFRSVGIPARVSGTPAWTTKRGNHNWVEVWTSPEKQWQFTEYYPDGKGLDHGWLLADAAKANPKSLYHSIYSSSWKPTGSHFPLVWDRTNQDIHAVNVSDFYIQLGKPENVNPAEFCELRIEFLDGNGKRKAIPISLKQGNEIIKNDVTPSAVDDMNRYLTITVKRGKLYKLTWTPPGSDIAKSKQFKVGDKEPWFLESLR